LIYSGYHANMTRILTQKSRNVNGW
jgi:hypothetical protein